MPKCEVKIKQLLLLNHVVPFVSDSAGTIEMTLAKWKDMCYGWRNDYRAIKHLRNSADYKAYMIYLNYAPEIQMMIYITHWKECLNCYFRRVTRMKMTMPTEE